MTYLDYETLLELYFYLIRDVMGSPESGILSEKSLRAALVRPQNAAQYEEADGIRQAAFLFHGLISGQGFVDGNKRVAFLSLGWFLERNGLGDIVATTEEIASLGFKTAAGQIDVDAIEDWVREHIKL